MRRDAARRDRRRFALRLEVDARTRGAGGCPLTIDLYRSERVIDTVVVYTAKADEGLAVEPAGLRPACDDAELVSRAVRVRRRGRGRARRSAAAAPR